MVLMIFLENGATPLSLNYWCGKQKFTIEDVYNIYGYMSFSLLAQKSDPLMTDIRNKYGIEYRRSRLDGSFDSLQIKMLKRNRRI
jgi:penicillin amidase